MLTDKVVSSVAKTSLRNKVLCRDNNTNYILVLMYVGFMSTLVVVGYLVVAIWMGKSVHQQSMCNKVYVLTESLTAALFAVISVSLTIAYLRLKNAI